MPILERAKRELDLMHVQVSPIDHLTLREAAFLLLKRSDRRMASADLLTMIGLADHLMIQRVGTPISGDDFFALPNGPIPIHLFFELREAHQKGQRWGERIVCGEYHLELVGSGECKSLSRGQRKVLEEAFVAIHDRPIGDVVETLAESCPEWLENLNKIIPLAEVYVAFGASVEDARDQVAEVRATYRRDGDRES